MAVNTLNLKEIDVALAHGNFLFVHELGKGSFGKVVRGVHKLDNCHYAIKTVICYSEQLKYQKRELDMLTSMNQDLSKSCHIIRYYNSWFCPVGEKQVLCIQMELCCGSLHKLLCRNPSIVQNGDFYKHVFRQILLGLEFIHNSRWLHRDIYPPNILIANPEPNKILDIGVKIADFGLATKLESSNNLSNQSTLDKLSPNVGNWVFRAPEMLKENYTTKVDMYSAGLVLYLLCCYLKNYENVWDKEIVAVRKNQWDKGNLCHKDKLVIALLEGLLQNNPEQRLSASEALARFNVSEIDGSSSTPRSRVKVLVRGDGESTYSRYDLPVNSFSELSQGMQDSFGVNKGNQIIRQEYKDSGETVMIKIDSEKAVDLMMSSAEKAGRVIRLELANKEVPGIVISNKRSCNEELNAEL